MLNNRSHRSEKPTHHKQSSPHSTQLEKARPKQWRPRTAKNNQIILFPSFCLTTFSFPTFSPNWLWTKTSVYDFQGLLYAKHHTNITIFGVCLLQHYKPYSLSQFNYFIIVMKLLFDTKTCLFVCFFFFFTLVITDLPKDLHWVAATKRVSPMTQRVKNLPVMQEIQETSIPASGRPPGGGNGNPLQESCLESRMDRGAWRATVQRVAKSQTWLSTHVVPPRHIRIHISAGSFSLSIHCTSKC